MLSIRQQKLKKIIHIGEKVKTNEIKIPSNACEIL